MNSRTSQGLDLWEIVDIYVFVCIFVTMYLNQNYITYGIMTFKPCPNLTSTESKYEKLQCPLFPPPKKRVRSTYHVDSILIEGVPLQVLRVARQHFGLEGSLQRTLLKVLTWTREDRNKDNDVAETQKVSIISRSPASNVRQYLISS